MEDNYDIGMARKAKDLFRRFLNNEFRQFDRDREFPGMDLTGSPLFYGKWFEYDGPYEDLEDLSRFVNSHKMDAEFSKGDTKIRSSNNLYMSTIKFELRGKRFVLFKMPQFDDSPGIYYMAHNFWDHLIWYSEMREKSRKLFGKGNKEDADVEEGQA